MTDKAAQTEQPDGVKPDAPEAGVTPEAAGVKPDKSPEGVTPSQPEASVTQADLDKIRQALDKEREQNKDLRSKIKGLVDPDQAAEQVKSVEDQLRTVTQERDQAQAEVLRLTVALAKGLPPDLARRLVGSSEDELTADADALLALVKPKVGTPHAKTGAGENGDQPARTLQDQINEAIKNGDTARVIALNTQQLAAAAAATP